VSHGLCSVPFAEGKVRLVYVVDVPGNARLEPKLYGFLPSLDFMSSMQPAADKFLLISFLFPEVTAISTIYYSITMLCKSRYIFAQFF
jgi:hypothetical protein